VVDVEAVESSRAPETPRTAEDREAICRLKTFTTAYAKDLAVAGKIPTDSILGWSELFYRYLQGEITVSDDELNDILKKARAAEEAQTRAARKPVGARTMENVAP